jgi:S-formylglutathione hydrolase FrmB
VEGKYKASTERKGRAVAGLSMGGYGALNLSLRFPTKFCAAGIISPAIYDPLPPEASASRKASQFVRDGKFDPDTWKALNYPAHLDKYAAGTARVPMWIVSGDHDYLGIALMSAQLHSRMMKIQPKQAELRIIDGDHEWMVFRDALPDALLYVDKQCAAGG